MKTLYFKPLINDELHDSGYTFIEIGYVENDIVTPIASCSDVINFGFAGVQDMPKDLAIDVRPDGTVRLWSYNSDLEWDTPILSTAIVKVKGDRA